VVQPAPPPLGTRPDQSGRVRAALRGDGERRPDMWLSGGRALRVSV